MKYHTESILKPVKANVTTFSGEKLDVIGKCMINCTYSDENHSPCFYVVDFACYNILGFDAIEELQLIKRVQNISIGTSSSVQGNVTGLHSLLSDFNDLFDGTVGYVSKPFKIILKDNALPVVPAA